MTNNPLVSIIVPVYNVEKYLARCLDSITAQTYQNLEIICVNDGATDSSPQILQSYAQKDLRIKIVNKPNGGLSSARNAGIKEATGQYMGFVDSDDYLAPHSYQKAVEAMLKDVQLVIWGAHLVAEGAQGDIPWMETAQMYHRVRFEGKRPFSFKTAKRTNVTVWNKLFRTDIIKKHSLQFPEGYIYEDNAFYWKYFPRVKNAYYLKEYNYFYVQRADSIMGRHFAKNDVKKLHSSLYVADNIYKYYEEHGLVKEHRRNLAPVFEDMLFLAVDNAPSEYKYEILAKAKEVYAVLPARLRKGYLAALFNDKFDEIINRKENSVFKKIFSVQNVSGYKELWLAGLKIRLKKIKG